MEHRDWEEHKVGFWQMFWRHLGPRNSLILARYAFGKDPVKFTQAFFEGKRLYGELKDGWGFPHQLDTELGWPFGNYFIGMPAGTTVDDFLLCLDYGIGNDKSGLSVVVATCTQGCVVSRNFRGGGHTDKVLQSSECIDGGIGADCGNIKCGYNYVEGLVGYYNTNHSGMASVETLTRTSDMVKDVLVPNLMKKVHGKASKNAFLFYVCPWATKETPFAGAHAVASVMDWYIMVSVLEGNICTREQFMTIEEKGVVDPNVRNMPSKQGIELLTSILGFNDYPAYPYEEIKRKL